MHEVDVFKVPHLRLAIKLPTLIAILSISIAMTLVIISYVNFRTAMMAAAKDRFETLVAARKEAVDIWLSNVDSDMQTLAENPATVQAVQEFSAAWANLEGDQLRHLQDAYIYKNPHPVGEKDKLDRAAEQTEYNAVHKKYHVGLRTFQKLKGYYDVFLFNTDGELVYSVFKEIDYATNFLTGSYAESGLGKAFRAAMDGQVGEVHAADFEPYAPSNGDGAAFTSIPLTDSSGKVVGVLAFQLPTERLLNITNGTSGLGETGQFYIVDRNYVTRSPSRFESGHKMLEKLKPSPQIDAGLNNSGQFFFDVQGVMGRPSVASSNTLEFHEAHWALVAEQDVSEVLAPVHALRAELILLVSVCSAVAIFVGWLLARSITRPVSRVGDAMQRVADEDFDVEVIDANRSDEMGEMARILTQFRDKLKLAKDADREMERRRQEQRRVVDTLSVGLLDLSKAI